MLLKTFIPLPTSEERPKSNVITNHADICISTYIANYLSFRSHLIEINYSFDLKQLFWFKNHDLFKCHVPHT